MEDMDGENIAGQKVIERQKIVEQGASSDKRKNRIWKNNSTYSPRAGNLLWLKAKKNDKGKLIFTVGSKHIGTIIIRDNYSDEQRPLVRRTLFLVLEGTLLLCRVQKVYSDFVNLRWQIEDDPLAELLFAKLDEIENPPKENAVEMIKIDVPNLKHLTIVGKIDLDAINAKTKPAKKTREEKSKESRERAYMERERRKALKEARDAAKKVEPRKWKRRRKHKQEPKRAENLPAEILLQEPAKLTVWERIKRLVKPTKN
jgi:hypothetical protein